MLASACRNVGTSHVSQSLCDGSRCLAWAEFTLSIQGLSYNLYMKMRCTDHASFMNLSTKNSIMRKVNVLLAIVAVAAISSSCASTFEKVNQTMVRVQEPEVGTVATPIVMELGEIPQQKITDTTIIDVDSYRHPGNQSYQRITQSMLIGFRKEALENAVVKYGCDVIVYPSFRIFTSEDGKTCYVIVSGYPAKYKRLRPATKDDLWMLEFMGKGDNFFFNNVRYEEDTETKGRRP